MKEEEALSKEEALKPLERKAMQEINCRTLCGALRGGEGAGAGGEGAGGAGGAGAGGEGGGEALLLSKEEALKPLERKAMQEINECIVFIGIDE